jgi:hypothetical protein
MGNTCTNCGKALHGRIDKRFCSLACKNSHNSALRRQTRSDVKEIDGYLHRNREILATILGDSKKEMIDRAVLVRAKFRWEFMTGYYINKENKMYRLVYDYAWMDFSDQQVMIVRKSK